MSDYDFSPVKTGHQEVHKTDVPPWMDELDLWVNQAEPRALSLWLIGRLRTITHFGGLSLLDEMHHWYSQPDEKLRWQIFHHAESQGFDTPAGALALSLFWSQGSMSPEGLAPVYPEPHLSGEMLRCVLLMLAAQSADNPAEGFHHLLAQWTKENS
ncbi:MULTISPECIES: DUF6931 family protein [Citrobacter]|uniref:DUF6931 family protein n=1 Tax=Citrobacter TaxID=544 RepID=UPI000CDDB070|nr:MULTISPECIES: hypothetical protein [Citrobacter]ELK6843039.1 hypothetical protein [Citrobacter braakii]POT29240.1 hypothetical protein C3423_24525 [Citrobacter braakii]POT34099.1 hypothetical protein C3431_24345 [Citrobacter braakii]POT38924.1 hypothetical protein C3425_24360 [Citrobacter braakii]POU80467.1 hypothetical protein C3426_24380 [Citrobacter braakii]